MIRTIAVSGYRSLMEVVLELDQLNLVTGANGSGKSSLYRSLGLLAETATGGLISSLANEGGLQSTLWAGPERISAAVESGQSPVDGSLRSKPVRLLLGFSTDEQSYGIDMGLPSPSTTAFGLDAQIKHEWIWSGDSRRARDMLVDRSIGYLRMRRQGSKWQEMRLPLNENVSLLSEYSDPQNAPEVFLIRDAVRSWRFYDCFRTDVDAPARIPRTSTFSPVLSADGGNLPAALQTILESVNDHRLRDAIDLAFPGSELEIDCATINFAVSLYQPGILRPLSGSELSDGTLRYLLLVAALLTPQPPSLMVLNEPETSLHPDLLPALGQLMLDYSRSNQLIVVTHSDFLRAQLQVEDACVHFELEKNVGATRLKGVHPLDSRPWQWPKR